MKAKKFYNPYPFVIRVKNDNNKDQLLSAHGGRGKILNGEYTQSPLKLLPYDHAEKESQLRLDGLDFSPNALKKPELQALAWAMCIKDIKDKTRSEIIELINKKL